jgi:MFS family permease
MIAIAFFGAGAIIAALASSFTPLLIGRSIQGVGAGGVIALTDIIITDLVPLRQRGKWLGLLNSMWAVGSVGGPMVGGFFTQEGQTPIFLPFPFADRNTVSWRWIFWINIPICVFGSALMAIFLRLHFKHSSFMEQLKRIDWIGSFIFILSSISFLIPITLGGVVLPWTSWKLLVPLSLGTAGLVGFVFYELHIPPEPLVRFSIFHTQTASVTYFQTFLHALVIYPTLYYLPLYYLAVKGLNPVTTAIAMFPETFTVAPTAIIVGILISVFGRYRWAMWSGWILTILGCGLLYLLDVDTSTPMWIFTNLVLGLGMGMIFQPVNMAIQSSVDTDDVAFAVSFASFLECFGEAIGIAVSGVIFQNRLRSILLSSDLFTKKLAVQYSKDATSLVSIIHGMHEHSEDKAALIQAYADSLKVVWIAMTILATIALASTIFVKDNSLDVELKTEQGYRNDEKVSDSENDGNRENK